MKTPVIFPKIRLHSLVPYDRGGKIRWLMDAMQIPIENKWLDGDQKEYDSEEFLRINPMGRVPAIEIDDLKMFESGAICAYLADRFLDKKMAPNLDSRERAAYQQWMYFAASTIEPFQTRIMIIEDMEAGEAQRTKLDALTGELGDALKTLDSQLAKNPYLLESGFSVADICVGYHLYWLKLWPELEAEFKPHPHVGTYLERLAKNPSAEAAKVFSYPG